VIDLLVSRFDRAWDVADDTVVGPGDDAAVLAVPDGRVVASTDLLLELRHFRRDWSTANDIGHKAAAQNLADLMAMGGTGTALLVALAAPADLPVQWVLELADGVAEEAARVGARVVGGDLSRSDQIVISVTALGSCLSDPVLRSGAMVGDVVAIVGRIGWAAAGVAVLARGFRSPRVVVEAHRRPDPPYERGPEAAALGATSMVDVSDGLLADLGHIASRSGVSIDLHAHTLDVPEPLQAVGAALGVDPMRFVLTGGEDHTLAATFPAETELPTPWRVIGGVREGEGVTVDGMPYAGQGGHDHFR
jgi:thiamine-monophosphate kinase